MDVEIESNPPPAYGEPLTSDQFDAKTQETLAVSVRVPQPAPQHAAGPEEWEAWDDNAFRAAEARNQTQGSSSGSSSWPSSSRSPPPRVNHNDSPLPSPGNHTPARTPPTDQKPRRSPLPQIPSSQLSRYPSTGKHALAHRDRKPMGARSFVNNASRSQHAHVAQLQHISEGIALKEAEYFGSNWQSAPLAEVASSTQPAHHMPMYPSSSTHSQSAQSYQQYYPTSSQTQYAEPPNQHISSPPTSPTVSVPPPVQTAPLLTTIPSPVEDNRHASLFGDNNAFSFRRRNDGEPDDDEAPPPFAPVAAPLGNAELEEAMAQLQGMQLSTGDANTAPNSALSASPTSTMAVEQSDCQSTSAPAVVNSHDQFLHQQHHVAPSPSTTPLNVSGQYRHSTPVAPSPSHTPLSNPSASAPAVISVEPPTAASSLRLQNIIKQPNQRYQPIIPPTMRFDASMAYTSGFGKSASEAGLQHGAASANEFYSASVSSTMKVGERRPAARHRQSTASSYASSFASTSSSNSSVPMSLYGSTPPPSSYSQPTASMYSPRQPRHSFTSSSADSPAIPATMFGGVGSNIYASSVRSGSPSGPAPSQRSSSPFSVRSGGMTSNEIGTVDRMGGGGGSGGGTISSDGYDMQQQSLALQQMEAALSNPSSQQIGGVSSNAYSGAMSKHPHRMSTLSAVSSLSSNSNMSSGSGGPAEQGGWNQPQAPRPPSQQPHHQHSFPSNLQQGGYYPNVPPPPAPPVQQPQQSWSSVPVQPSTSFPQNYPSQQQAPRPVYQNYQQQPQQARPPPPPQRQYQQMPHAPQAPQHRYSNMY